MGSDLLGSEKVGPKAETVRLWVRRAETESGRQPGATTGELVALSARTPTCVVPRTFSRPSRISSGRSSTASPRSDRVHRRQPAPVVRVVALGDRADLCGVAARPVDVSRSQEAPVVGSGGSRCRAQAAGAAGGRPRRLEHNYIAMSSLYTTRTSRSTARSRKV